MNVTQVILIVFASSVYLGTGLSLGRKRILAEKKTKSHYSNEEYIANGLLITFCWPIFMLLSLLFWFFLSDQLVSKKGKPDYDKIIDMEKEAKMFDYYKNDYL